VLALHSSSGVPDTPPASTPWVSSTRSLGEPTTLQQATRTTDPAGSDSSRALPTSAAEGSDCLFNPQGGTEVFSTSTYRPANYVYLVAKKNTTVCIQDGQHTVSQVKLALGATQSVYGAPPWHLRLQDLDSVDVFFQGHHVLLPPTDNPQFTLIQYAQDNHP
jgi:hypothetical protein